LNEGLGEHESAVLLGGDGVGAEHPGFEAGGAEDGLLGEGDAFDGVALLGVLRLVELDGVGDEVFDLVVVFEIAGSVGDGGESMFAGVLAGAGSGGFGGVGSICSLLPRCPDHHFHQAIDRSQPRRPSG
jgi:hypothetical protein